MAKKEREVKVHPEFDKSLYENYQYLKQESPQFAAEFKDELITQMERIIEHPLAYPKEEDTDILYIKKAGRLFIKFWILRWYF